MHSSSLLGVRVPPCFMPPLDMQPWAYPRVARYTLLRASSASAGPITMHAAGAPP